MRDGRMVHILRFVSVVKKGTLRVGSFHGDKKRTTIPVLVGFNSLDIAWRILHLAGVSIRFRLVDNQFLASLLALPTQSA